MICHKLYSPFTTEVSFKRRNQPTNAFGCNRRELNALHRQLEADLSVRASVYVLAFVVLLP